MSDYRSLLERVDSITTEVAYRHHGHLPPDVRADLISVSDDCRAALARLETAVLLELDEVEQARIKKLLLLPVPPGPLKELDSRIYRKLANA